MSRIVVYVTQLLDTGGIESHLKEFCNHMSTNKVSIDLVVLNSSARPETENFYRAICHKVYFGKYGRSVLRVLWLFVIGLVIKFRKYDTLYTNGQGESIGFFARLIAPRHWVHHHHTSGDAADQSTWGNGYRSTLQRANTVIACSFNNANEMKKVISNSINVIPCFSRQIVYPYAIHNHDRQKEKLHFGYYGRLIPEKGIDIICKLSQDADLEHISFHLWGEGPSYPATFFEQFKNVTYYGKFSSREELSEIINSLDAFLLLSVHPEGLPISLLEAMSAGLPWLATDRGGIPDIACDPVATRVIPATYSYQQIKESVQQLAADIKAGHINKEKQIKLYEEKFSSLILVSQWKEALCLN